MNQIAIDFARPGRVPEPGTQCGALLRAFQRGERLTVAEALTRYGVYALSQRCGELRRSGWPIRDEWHESAGGARVKRYFIEAA